MLKKLSSLFLTVCLTTMLTSAVVSAQDAYAFQMSKTYYSGNETVVLKLDSATAAVLKAKGDSAFFRTVVGEVGDLATASLAGLYDRVYCGGIREDNTLEIPMRVSPDLTAGMTVYGAQYGAGEAVRMAGAYTMVLFVNDGSGAKAVAKSETFYLCPQLAITAAGAVVEPWTKPNDTDYKSYFVALGDGGYLQKNFAAFLCNVTAGYGYTYDGISLTLNGVPVPQFAGYDSSLPCSYSRDYHAVRFGGMQRSKDDARIVKALDVVCRPLFTVSGSAEAGKTLTVSGTAGETVAWQESADGESWSDIAGAGQTEYTVTAANVGKFIRVHITDGTGHFYSAPTGKVTGGTHTVSFEVGENGGVLIESTPVPGSISVEDGQSFSFTVVPDQGYEIASVTAGQTPLVVGSDGAVTLERVAADVTISVAFRQLPQVGVPQISGSENAVFTQTDYQYQGSGKAYNSVVIYASILVPTGWELESYGVEFSDDGGNIQSEPLAAYGHSSDWRYGVRIYGEGLTSGIYYARGYAVLKRTADGTALTVKEAAQREIVIE